MQLPRTPVKKMKEWQVLEDIKEKKFPVYVENAAVERTEVSLCLGDTDYPRNNLLFCTGWS